jgi:hypothetical protein
MYGLSHICIVLERASRPAGEIDRRNGRTFFYVTKKAVRRISPEFVMLEDLVDQVPCKPFRVS